MKAGHRFGLILFSIFADRGFPFCKVFIADQMTILVADQHSRFLKSKNQSRIDTRRLHRLHDTVFDVLKMLIRKQRVFGRQVVPQFIRQILQVIIEHSCHFIGHRNRFTDRSDVVFFVLDVVFQATLLVLSSASTGALRITSNRLRHVLFSKSRAMN